MCLLLLYSVAGRECCLVFFADICQNADKTKVDLTLVQAKVRYLEKDSEVDGSVRLAC